MSSLNNIIIYPLLTNKMTICLDVLGALMKYKILCNMNDFFVTL